MVGFLQMTKKKKFVLLMITLLFKKSKMQNGWQKWNMSFMLLLILFIHLFFRLFRFEGLLGFGHDEDLAGWIVKDILVDHHLRLIGQETSIDGVFIGPLFYYLQAIFYFLFNMDPIGAYFLVLLISIATFFSIYFVFSRLFDRKVGLIGVFIYTCSLGLVGHERWIVPTNPTLLWCVWYLYLLLSVIKGNLNLYLVAILFGLIWHIHVALIPLTVMVPILLILSRKKINLKEIFSFKKIIISSFIFSLLISPLVLFEIRHNFLQTKSIFAAASKERNDISGLDRVIKIADGISLSVSAIFYADFYWNPTKRLIAQIAFSIIYISSLIYIFKYYKNVVLVALFWLSIIFISQFISKRAISEYYFTNLAILNLLVFSLFLNKILKNGLKLKVITLSTLFGFLVINIVWLVNYPNNSEGYLYRKQLVRAIKEDAVNKGYPCIAINYITFPGKAAGYNYFFWLNDLKTITPGNDVPVYSIVNPAGISAKEIEKKFGNLGYITPKNFEKKDEVCKDPKRQLLDPWGFTN